MIFALNDKFWKIFNRFQTAKLQTNEKENIFVKILKLSVNIEGISAYLWE